MPNLHTLTHCPYCQTFSDHFTSVQCICSFESHARLLIHAFKYHNATYLRNDFIALFQHLLCRVSFEPQSIIVPIPLHHKRQKQRGYNQSLYLAKALSKALHPFPHTLRPLLKRVKNTPTQITLTHQQRLLNLKNAFALTSHKPLDPQCHYYLIDDVITSGATMLNAGKALRNRGACHLHAIAICHTPMTSPH